MKPNQPPLPPIPSMTKKELIAFKEMLHQNRLAYFQREAKKRGQATSDSTCTNKKVQHTSPAKTP